MGPEKGRRNDYLSKARFQKAHSAGKMSTRNTRYRWTSTLPNDLASEPGSKAGKSNLIHTSPYLVELPKSRYEPRVRVTSATAE